MVASRETKREHSTTSLSASHACRSEHPKYKINVPRGRALNRGIIHENQLPTRTGMLPTANNWIPDAPPTLRFRAEVPLFWASSLDLPILHRGMVLVACGTSHAVVAGQVLAGIDALTGEQRLRVDVRLQHPREVSASLPGTLEDGRILLPVYVHDTYLKVLAIDLQGTVVAEDDLGTNAGRDVRRELNICANDSGIKMFLAPLAVTSTPETYVVSWIYRQYAFHTQVRQLGCTSPNWSSNEWTHCLIDGVVVGETSEVPDG